MGSNPVHAFIFLRLWEKVITKKIRHSLYRTKQSRNLAYCNKCADQLISGIKNDRLMSKLQNTGRRDKTTKGMKECCARIGHFQHMSNGSTLFSHTHWGTKPLAHHLDASSGEEYELDIFAVDIKPEIHAQTVYNTSQNLRGAALGGKLSSPLELGVTKDINKSIMVTYCLHMQHTAGWNCSIVDPSRADDQKLFHPQQSNLIH